MLPVLVVNHVVHRWVQHTIPGVHAVIRFNSCCGFPLWVQWYCEQNYCTQLIRFALLRNWQKEVIPTSKPYSVKLPLTLPSLIGSWSVVVCHFEYEVQSWWIHRWLSALFNVIDARAFLAVLRLRSGNSATDCRTISQFVAAIQHHHYSSSTLSSMSWCIHLKYCYVNIRRNRQFWNHVLTSLVTITVQHVGVFAFPISIARCGMPLWSIVAVFRVVPY